MIMLNHNLRIFISVAEKGSFTATADELFITQPAISRAIKALEDELNLKLFHRDKRKGLILTDAGQKILVLARQMLDMENRIYQTAFRENNFLGGKVRIASMPILTSVILSKVFFAFQKKYPYVTLELMEGNTPEIRKAVEEHQVDFGFTASPFGELDSHVVLKDRMVAISKEPLFSDEPVNLYNGESKYILCQAGYETVIEELQGEKIKLSGSFIVQQAESVINFVEQKNGIGIISEFVLNATPNSLIRLPITPCVEMDLGLIAYDLNDLTPVATALINMVKEECHNYRINTGEFVNVCQDSKAKRK